MFMPRLILRIPALAILALSLLCQQSNSNAVEIKIDKRTFTLPDGFTIEKVANSPLVDRPINGSFDEQGRLYLSDSSGSNDKVEIQVVQKPHRIVRLEDTNGDGIFDKSVVFADKMMFPEGTLWHRGSLYVSAPPSIWKLTDTDNDGVADQRVEWFQGKTLTGCANDLHGPYLGRDGRIYWAKGAFAEQNHIIHGKPWKTSASHFFRSTEDGRELEPVMTGGMDNPVDMVFTLGGERIFTTTFLTQPSLGQRDGLIHAVYGGIYGKTNGKTQEPQHLWTGPNLMPVLSHLGPAAPSGLTDYESDAFGPDFRNNIFSSSFNLRKISRHQLTTTGSALSSKDTDFLVCDDTDFHPTDIFTDADGSLIVIDTGGWYRLCCPSSYIAKADVLGVVYRIRQTRAKPVADPRGTRLAWADANLETLVDRLDDQRFAVRDHSMDSLAAKGNAALPSLMAAYSSPKASANHRLQILWTACRIASPDALALIRKGLNDNDTNALQAAVHCAGLNRDSAALDRLIAILLDTKVQTSVHRAVAEALGRLGKPEAVGPILTAASKLGADRVLQHSLTFALIEINSVDAIFEALKSAQNPISQMVGIIALDQLGVMLLPVAELVTYMDAPDETVRSLASWVVSRHPEWARELVADFQTKLATPPTDPMRSAALIDRLARFSAKSPDVQTLMTNTLEHGSKTARQVVIKAMASSGLKPCPAAWESALLKVFRADGNTDLFQPLLDTFKALTPPGTDSSSLRLEALLAKAKDASFKPESQWAALTTIPAGVGPVSTELFDRISQQINPSSPSMTRLAAVDILLRIKLTQDQKRNVAKLVGSAGPMETQKLLAMFESVTDPAVADTLMTGLEKSMSLSALREDALKNVVAKLSNESKARMEKILAKRNQDLVEQRKQVDSLLAAFPKGDMRRGLAIFNGAKAACRTCHSIGYVGGKVGPDLTKIGQIRNEKDLLESIVYPSSTFVRSYEPVTIALSDGRVLAGIVQGENTETMNLVLNATQTVQIPKAEIDDVSPGTVSIMPAGLDKQLTTQELADLITYLRSSR